jgi:predicted RNA binding protein YcfA (HicA-like mRNA interferase family)
MPELYSSRYIIKVLKEQGFEFVSQKGSHKKFKKGSRIVIIPDPKKEIPTGTFNSILKQSNLRRDDFRTKGH